MRRVDTKLSPLSQLIFFTQLVPVMSLLWGCVVFCVLCGLFLFGFVFGVVVAFGSLCFVSCSLMNVTRE